MNRLKKTLCCIVLPGLMLAAYEPVLAAPLGTAFTYQGDLQTDAGHANGHFDLTFALFNGPVAGAQIGETRTNLNVAVSNGLFTTTVDFGPGVFDGTAYWLAIGVRSNGSAVAFANLIPRQSVTPTPYALYATAAPVANDSVTSANIVNGTIVSADIADGTIASADLAPNSVNTTHIIDGQVMNADLANNAVNSVKVLDGSLLGTDLANNTVTSVQLADSIALGDATTTGQLDVFRNATGTESIRLFGNSSQISTYGSDGLEQIRLYGTSWGEMFLYDSTTNNNLSVDLSANSAGGGYLRLNQGSSSSIGAYMLGDSLGGGRLLLYNSNATSTVDFRSQYDSTTPAAWGTFKDGTSERVSIAARNGSSGRGGLVDVKNNSALKTVSLVGDNGASRGAVQVYDTDGTTLIGALEGHSGGSWLRTYDEAGQQTGYFGSSASSGGFAYLYKASGSLGLYMDGESSGAGYVAVYGTNGAAVIQLDGQDSGGNGRIITQVLQITGGSDLSEQFDIINPLPEKLQPGTVVCIDPQNAGQLTPSTKAYDRTVAGVVSGAGGILPGMLMGQRGTQADGKHPVALTGRVYVKADAANGAIEPGDLLTTSTTPGHAMKVTRHNQAQGAILGKAMSRLSTGKGMVLVLVSLQ